MDPEQRLYYVVVGLIIGMVIGYFVRVLQTGDFDLRIDRNKKGWRGWFAPSNLAFPALLCILVWSTVSTGMTNSNVRNTQESLEQNTKCIRTTLSDTISALSERTTYTRSQTDATAQLQKAQSEYLRIRLQYTADDPIVIDALEDYFNSIRDYLKSLDELNKSQPNNPYPTPEEFDSCLKDLP